MLYHGAKAGAFDLKTTLMEVLASMRRAGNYKIDKVSYTLIDCNTMSSCYISSVQSCKHGEEDLANAQTGLSLVISIHVHYYVW